MNRRLFLSTATASVALTVSGNMVRAQALPAPLLPWAQAAAGHADARIAAARIISRLPSLDGAGALQTGHKNAGGLDKAGL